MPSSHVAVSHLVTDPAVAAAAVAAGARALKMKVGSNDLETDLGRIAAVRLAIGEDATIRIDANRLWSLDTAKAAMPDLETLGVELIEEPTKDPKDMRALRCMGPAIAADESVRTPAELAALIDSGWVDAVVLKPMIIGAPERAVEMARTAAGAGLGVMVTTTLESWVGRRCALHIAAAVPEDARLACGLMTGAWLSNPLCSDPEVIDGEVAVPTGPGLDLGQWRHP
jgi:o-succinylbenzoate synthase